MSTIEISAVVPHPDANAVLVTETESGYALPSATADSDDDTPTRLAAVTKPWSIDSAYLRQGASVEHNGRRLILEEFEPVDGDGRTWLPLAELARLDLPEALRPSLDTWAAYLRGREYPRYRPAWTRPGWFAGTRDWLDEQLTHYGIAPAGQPAVVQQWAISAVLKQPTHGHGDYYLKAVFGGPGRGFWHEPRLSAALAREHPGDVPAVTVINADRGLLLMPDMGITSIGDHPVDKWDDGLRVLARIQRHWAGRRDELLALGCPDRDLSVTPDQLDAAFADPLVTDLIDAKTRSRLEGLLPRWRELFTEALDWPVPSSLLHGDYHPGNVGLRPDGSACGFDWSDGAWGHPFLDVATYVHNCAGKAKARLWDVYLEQWTDYAPLPELRRLIPAATTLRMLYATVSYQGIMANVDPDDRFVFAEWANTYWKMSLDAWDAMA